MRTNLLLLFMVMFLSGCASNLKIHVYAKYLEEAEKQDIKSAFASLEDVQVELNEFDFPATVTQNTMLYSLLLSDPESIDAVSGVAESVGLPIGQIQEFSQGNHWYTNNSIALFLYPQNKEKTGPLFRQDLINTYQGQACGEAIALSLKEDGSFRLENKPSFDPVVGTWAYRQYPYVELKIKGSDYSSYYFEIQQTRDTDQISDIDIVKLHSLNTGYLPEGCAFLVGTRS